MGTNGDLSVVGPELLDEPTRLGRQQGLEGVVGPELLGSAKRAARDLKCGRSPDPGDLSALKAAFLRRPALRVMGSVIEPLPTEAEEFRARWSTALPGLRSSLAGVGLMSCRQGDDTSPLGTVFLVSPMLAVTNRHVVEQMSWPEGNAAAPFIHFAHTPESSGPTSTVARIAHVSSTHDLAVLQLTETAAPSPLALADSADAAIRGQVCVIGYPYEDGERNPLFAEALLGDNYRYQAVAPGALTERRGSQVAHNCTTSGGNSGSPIISLDTGLVVAVHSKGYFLERNVAVPVETLQTFLGELDT